MASTNGHNELAEVVERVSGDRSQQSRFKEQNDSWVLKHVLHMVATAEISAPSYDSDTRRRDQWLRDFSRQESFLEGILNSVIQIDANRGWSITGGRNQVLRFAHVFHNAENGEGWRYYIKRLAEDFYQTDIGAITEIGTAPGSRALRAIWNVDAAQARLTGKSRYPLEFEGKKWREDDFFRVVSKPSANQDMHGAGRCALSRALEVSKVMLGIILHSQEKLAARLPKGFLSIYPVSDDTWAKIEEDAKRELENAERRAFGGIRVLRSEDEAIQVALTSLSQLPDGFDLAQWVEVLMSAYALIFGYDVSEFYSPRSSGFSRGAESEVQAAKATGKGEKEFALGYQDKVNQSLPESINFQFQERDERAEAVIADIHEKVAKIAATLTTKVIDEEGNEQPILERRELRSLLAMRGVIPAEWTEIIEDVTTTDTREERARLREQFFVQRAAELYPEEPIVRLHWPTGRLETFWSRGADAIQRFYPAYIGRATLYEDASVTITDEDVDAALDVEFPEGSIADLLNAEARSDD